MLVPFDEHRAGAAAGAPGVKDPGLGYEADFPAFLAKAHAQVQVLAVQEVAFVPAADAVQGFALDQHAGAGNGFYLRRTAGQGLAVQKKVGKQSRREPGQARQVKGAYYCPPWGGEDPTSTGLFAAVEVAQ